MKSFQLHNSEAGGTVIAVSVFIAFVAFGLGVLLFTIGEVSLI